MRMITAVRSVVGHPAFWLAMLGALGVDALVYGLRLSPHAIQSDGWGYYLQLPAIFVYGDPHLAFLNRPGLPPEIAFYHFPDGSWQGLSAHGAGYLDKYAFGPAVLQLPFFLVASAVSHVQYAAVNGFERAFQIANAVSGAFYFGLGSLVLYRACRLRYEVLPSALAVGLAGVATNLLFYASFDGAFSHIYGFCVLSGVVHLTVRRAQSHELPTLPAFALFGFLMGLAVMVRPTNAIYAPLFVVFARGVPPARVIAGGACGVLASAVAASPQMILWYVTTGRPIYYSYVGEGFNFGSPELRNYLFSIRKGVFFWHPLYLLMIAALPWQFPQRRLETAVSLLVVLSGLYLGASWGDYTFGDSFGSRQSVELLPILTVPFAGTMARLMSVRWRSAAAALAAVLVALNAVHFAGYALGRLPHNNATRVSYLNFWATTLRLPVAGR